MGLKWGEGGPGKDSLTKRWREGLALGSARWRVPLPANAPCLPVPGAQPGRALSWGLTACLS